MAVKNQIRLRFDEIRTLAFGDIDATYNPIGSTIGYAGRMFQLQNMTDEAVMITFDQYDLVDHIYLPSNGFFVVDTTTNRTNQTDLYIEDGTRVFAKHLGNQPTAGAVYLTLAYGG